MLPGHVLFTCNPTWRARLHSPLFPVSTCEVRGWACPQCSVSCACLPLPALFFFFLRGSPSAVCSAENPLSLGILGHTRAPGETVRVPPFARRPWQRTTPPAPAQAHSGAQKEAPACCCVCVAHLLPRGGALLVCLGPSGPTAAVEERAECRLDACRVAIHVFSLPGAGRAWTSGRSTPRRGVGGRSWPTRYRMRQEG